MVNVPGQGDTLAFPGEVEVGTREVVQARPQETMQELWRIDLESLQCRTKAGRGLYKLGQGDSPSYGDLWIFPWGRPIRGIVL